MAKDEALLEFAAHHGHPVLRFYGWDTAAATFGYFQAHAEIAGSTALRPLIRRPTGGGLVPHDADWTYALVVPSQHAWYSLSARDSYRRMHEWLRDAFRRTGLDCELADCCAAAGAGRCFGGGWEQHDLLCAGRKLAGAAQRRNKLGLLIQGSVQPAPSAVSRNDWQRAMLAVAPVAWVPLSPTAALEARAVALADEKYGSARYNERR